MVSRRMPELVVPTRRGRRAESRRSSTRGRSRSAAPRRSRPRAWPAGSRCRSSIPPRTCGSRVDDARLCGRLRGRVRAGGRHPEGVDRPAGADRQRRRARAALRVGAGRGAERVGSGGTLQFFADERDRGAPGPSRRCRIHRRAIARSRWSARSTATSRRPSGRPASRLRAVRRARRRGGPCRHRRGFPRPLGLRPDDVRGLGAQNLGHGEDAPSGASPGTETRSPVSASTGRAAARTRPSAGSECSPCGAPGVAAGSARRCSGTRLRCSPSAASAPPGSGWMPRTRPAPSPSTSGSGMHVVRRSDTGSGHA